MTTLPIHKKRLVLSYLLYLLNLWLYKLTLFCICVLTSIFSVVNKQRYVKYECS